jgi:hypothetical protein
MNPILPNAVCVPVPLAGDRLRGRWQFSPSVKRRVARPETSMDHLLANKTGLIAAVGAAPFRFFLPYLRLF